VRLRFVFPLVLVACGPVLVSRADGVDDAGADARFERAVSSSAVTPAPPPPAAPPAIVVTNVGPTSFEVTNKGTGAVKLEERAAIERRGADEVWTALDGLDLGRGYHLAEGCERAPKDRCVDLAAGASLRPAPFRGYSCSSQCNGDCDKNVWLSGSFRLSVTTCDGARIAGPAFTLPDSSRMAAVDRLWAATDVFKVVAARLDPANKSRTWDGTTPRTAGRIADFVVAGPERELPEAARAQLADLLKDDKGYDDRVAKRCAMGKTVGFRISKTLATTDTQPHVGDLEMAIDFNCQKLFLTRDGAGGRRVVHATHFDPSRPAFLAFAKTAVPDADLK
jgi:hypothetical protein